MNKKLLALPVVLLAACSGPRTNSAPTPVAVQAAPGFTAVVGGAGRAERSFGAFGGALLGSRVAAMLEPGREYTIIAVRDRDLAAAAGELAGRALAPRAVDTVLAFHVLPGRIGSELLRADTSFETLSGQRLFVSNWGGEVEVYARGADGSRTSSARVLETDVAFDGGLVHIVDRPLMPATDDLRTTLERLGGFELLLAAAEVTGATAILEAPGPFTLLAPTNEAFAQALGGQVDFENVDDPALLRERVLAVLQAHLIDGRHYSSEFATGEVRSVTGTAVPVDFVRRRFRFGGASVLRTDLEAQNGVIHVVDGIVGR